MADHEHPGNLANSAAAAVEFGALTDDGLRDEVQRLTRREHEISFQRRFLHGQIELARGELARRLTLDTPMTITRAEIEELDRLLQGIQRRDAS